MSEEIFRKKSLEKISAPESLNDYIRVSNPGVWLLLVAVVVLLIGMCIWGFFGHIDGIIPVNVQVKADQVTCIVKETDVKLVRTGMTVQADGVTGVITEIGKPASNQVVCEVEVDGTLPEGIYAAELFADGTHPFAFVLN